MGEHTTDVLIVGAGVAGLSASAFLSAHGVESVLVEKHDGLSIHPRARGLNPRAVELLRCIGLDDELMSATAGFVDFTVRARVESLTGREIDSVTLPTPVELRDISPSRWCLGSQDRVEPLLRARAEKLGGTLLFGAELVGFERHPDHVVARLGDRTIRARYLIAADGPRSGIREHLGIGRTGPGVMAHQMSILFRADLTGPLRGRRFAVCQVMNPAVRGILAHDDTLQVGTLIVRCGADERRMAPDRCLALIRAAVGDPDFDAEIQSTLPWELAAWSASRYRDGPVFLIGDAAHVLPPVGGFGASSAIQDAHNLAWKLAQVLGGTAGAGLLDTYDAERRPIGELTVRQSQQRITSGGGVTAAAKPADQLDELTLTFGYRYPPLGGAGPDGAGTDHGAVGPEDPRVPSAAPGARAPHLVLDRAGERLSTLDLFRSNLVVLAGPDGGHWQKAADRAATRLSTRIDVHVLGPELADLEGRWNTAYGLGTDAAVLVRPDGFVAWRSDGAEPLDAALDRVLFRRP